mgnify:FL=1
MENNVPAWYVNLEYFMKTLAVDFDGVIHEYSGWNNGELNNPVAGAVDAWTKLENAGYTLVVFTCREDLDRVQDWFHQHFGFIPEITNTKPVAVAYIDDRAIRFTNWEDIRKYFC